MFLHLLRQLALEASSIHDNGTGCPSVSGRGGGTAGAEGAAMRIGRAPDERVGVEPVIHGEVRHVLVHRVLEATTDPGRVPCRWLEQKFGPIDTIDDPRVLTIDRCRIITDDAADDELGIDPDLAQLAPGPQREVLAVAAAEFLKAGGMLPHVALMKQFEVRDVLAGLQPRDDVVDRLHRHGAWATEVLSEGLHGPGPEDSRRYPYRQTVPSRFAANQARREA